MRQDLAGIPVAAGVALLAVFTVMAVMPHRIELAVATDQSSVGSLLTETEPPPGFSFALAPRRFQFPVDHGPRPLFRSKW